MNKWYGIGRLGKDAEFRATGTGISVCTFSIGVSRRDKEKTTDWINIITW